MPQDYDKDIDEIMSSIMQNQHRTNIYSPTSVATSQTATEQTKVHALRDSESLRPLRTNSKLDAPTTSFKTTRSSSPLRKSKHKLILSALSLSLLTGFGFMITTVWGWYNPSSPFPQVLSANTSYPLLFPTYLPTGYKIDKTSISQAENGAVVYAARNGDKLINISLQAQPADLNLTPLFETMDKVRRLDTPAGPTTIGVTKDKMLTAHTLTDTVWVITRIPIDTISDQDLDKLLGSFSEG